MQAETYPAYLFLKVASQPLSLEELTTGLYAHRRFLMRGEI